MSLLEIRKAGDPVLKEVCAPVERVDKRLRQMLDDMAETMYAADGVGIAAPQVGKALRAIVIDVGKKRGKERYDLINPVITDREGSCVDTEGCLSVPKMYGDVERAEKVTVEYTTRYGKRRKLEADALLARCVQHELDHLNGILFIDLAKSLRQETEES